MCEVGSVVGTVGKAVTVAIRDAELVGAVYWQSNRINVRSSSCNVRSHVREWSARSVHKLVARVDNLPANLRTVDVGGNSNPYVTGRRKRSVELEVIHGPPSGPVTLVVVAEARLELVALVRRNVVGLRCRCPACGRGANAFVGTN